MSTSNRPLGKTRIVGLPPKRASAFAMRQYLAVSDAVRAAYKAADRPDYRLGVSAVADALAREFKQDNPRFDLMRFVQACTRDE